MAAIVERRIAEIRLRQRRTDQDKRGAGDFGCAHLAGDIGKLSRIVTLNNISIAADTQRKDGTLVMNAVTKTFRYLDAEELAAKKRAAEAAAKGGRK